MERLSAADQQFVKILKALAPSPKVLIMDEPTAMFNMKDTDMVLDLVKNISRKGIGIIYISTPFKGSGEDCRYDQCIARREADFTYHAKDGAVKYGTGDLRYGWTPCRHVL